MLSQKQTNCASTYPSSGNFYGQCFSDNLPSSLPKEINNLKRRPPQLPQVVLSRSKICHSPINFLPSVQRTALKFANPESCMFDFFACYKSDSNPLSCLSMSYLEWELRKLPVLNTFLNSKLPFYRQLNESYCRSLASSTQFFACQ